jgi:hypothetical protein
MSDIARPSPLGQPTSSVVAVPWHASAANPAAVPSIFGGLTSAGHITLAELVVAAAAGVAERGEVARVDVSGETGGQEEYKPPVDLAEYAARRAARPRRAGSRARCR